jgi:hypothetical protein
MHTRLRNTAGKPKEERNVYQDDASIGMDRSRLALLNRPSLRVLDLLYACSYCCWRITLQYLRRPTKANGYMARKGTINSTKRVAMRPHDPFIAGDVSALRG